MRPIYFLLVVSVLLPRIARADELDDIAHRAMTNQHIPGLVVLVTKDGQTVHRIAYGESNRDTHTPMTPDGVFEIGSITKTFNATLVMKLVEDGRVGLGDAVTKYLPKAPPAWKDITVERLLSHESGLPDYAFVPGLGLLDKWTLDDWWAKMPALPLDFAPGTDAAYSNTNYVLLGQIVEKVEGRPLKELVEERLIKPLGLTHTSWKSAAPAGPDRVHGYIMRKAGIVDAPPITETGYDGGLLSTADDLALFESDLRAGKILKPETVTRMRTAELLPGGHRTPFGLCWWIASYHGHPIVAHGGQTAGFASNLSWFPDEKLQVVVLANLSDVGTDLLAREIAGVSAPEFALTALPEVTDPDRGLTAKLGAALNALAYGDASKADPGALDPEYAAKLQTPRGKRALGGLSAFKEIVAMNYIETEPDEADRLVRYRVRNRDHQSFIVAFVVTKDSRIYSIALRREAD